MATNESQTKINVKSDNINTLISASNHVASQDLVNTNILFSLIPKYGNRDTRNLHTFIRNCKTANKLANESQKPLVMAYALAQLDGPAASFANSRSFNTLDNLLEHLKLYFCESKTQTQLLVELTQVYQGNDTVARYGARMSAIRDELFSQIEGTSDVERHCQLQIIDKMVLGAYLSGLEEKLGTVVRARNPKNTNAAALIATEEEKIQNLIRVRKNNFQNKPSPSIQKPQQVSKPNFANNKSQQFQPKPPFTCNYCKLVGHKIEDCRKRQYNENLKKHTIHNLNANEECEAEQSNSETEVEVQGLNTLTMLDL